MAENNGKRPPFDPYEAPTIIEQAPIAGAQLPPPEPEPAGTPAKPKDIGALLGDAFNLYKNNFVAFLLVALVGMGPVAVIASGIHVIGAGIGRSAPAAMQVDAGRLQKLQAEMQEAAAAHDFDKVRSIEQEEMQLSVHAIRGSVGFLAWLAGMALLTLLVIPLWMLAFFLTQAAITALSVDRARQGKMTWQGAWGAVFKRLGSLVGVSALVAIGIGVGSLLCVLPGLVFAFFTCFALLAVYVEKKDTIAAIKRSFELAKTDPLRTLVVLVVFGLLTFVAQLILGLLIPSGLIFFHSLAGSVGSIVITPFGLIGLTLLYQDIRRTKLNESDAQLQAEANDLLPGT